GVAQVVLAEVAADVAVRLEHFGDRRVLRLDAQRRPRQADLGQAGADRRLPHDERRAPGRAALLAVPVGEAGALPGDAVDVRRLVAHDAAVIAARVEPADVVTPDDEDVRLLAVLRGRAGLLAGLVHQDGRVGRGSVGLRGVGPAGARR